MCLCRHMLEVDSTCSSKLDLDWVGPLVLCVAEVGRMPAGVPGVYLLHAFRADRGLYEVFYAGKTSDLRGRLAQHLVSGCTSPDVRWLRVAMTLYFSAAPVLRSDERTIVETGLIQMLRPPFNRQVPCGVAAWPNLPPLTLGSRRRFDR